jgi:hypothetical protein
MTQPLFAIEDGEHSEVTAGGSTLMTSRDLGEISESKFELRASELGWLVASPRGTNRDFDAIVMRRGGRPIVVQIKRSNVVQGADSKSYAINCSRRTLKSGTCKNVLYDENAFDVLAAHLPDIDKWMFFTRSELGSRQKTTYCPPDFRQNKRKTHYGTHGELMSDRNPDNWELLDQVAAMHSQESAGVSQQMSHPILNTP